MDRDAAAAYLKGLSRFGIRPGLERMRYLLDALGHPERHLRVIHVAGTNGKGSTAAILASILTAAGHRTGLYTSPHLTRYEERIRLDGRPITAERLAGLVERLRPVVEACAGTGLEHPTEFEVGTAAMYLYFAEEAVEVVVQEAGLGGRLDATNLIERPLVTLVTPIAMDHAERLGGGLREIAREKAGIARPGVQLISAEQPAEAMAVLEDVTGGLGSPLIRVGREARVDAVSVTAAGSSFDYRGRRLHLEGLRLGLLGRHQVGNAACALAAVDATVDAIPVPEAAIRRGLASVRWPGRLELIPGSPPVLLDGAHNTAGARALAEALSDLWPGRRPVLVLGVLRDKDAEAMINELLPKVASVVATRFESPRAMEPAELADLVKAAGGDVSVSVDPARALATARALAGGDGMILVAGSLYLVGLAGSLLVTHNPS